MSPKKAHIYYLFSDQHYFPCYPSLINYSFQENKYLDEFFKSASFTLYVLTLSLNLPDAYFYRIINKYEGATYESTIKLIIRCKIFYEARETLFDIIRTIIEREYTAALIQTQIAKIENWERIDYKLLNEIKIDLKELLAQSNSALEKIRLFKNIKPFDRPFIYKGDEYENTMKDYYGMLKRVLKVYDIDLDLI